MDPLLARGRPEPLTVTADFSGSPGEQCEKIEPFDFRREDCSPGFWRPGSKWCALLFG
jgi:hypothetical protein